MLEQNLNEIVQAVFEPFSINKFLIIVGTYNKGKASFQSATREIKKLVVGTRVQIQVQRQ